MPDTTTTTLYPLPAWWAGATTVTVEYFLGTDLSFTVPKADIELLPQGVAWTSGATSRLVPWSRVTHVVKAS